MHETKLYFDHPSIAILETVVDKLVEYINLTCTPAQYATIYDKTKKFILLWTKRWLKDFGLIERNPSIGIITRIEIFEDLWKSRMETWHAGQKLLIDLVYIHLLYPSSSSLQILIMRYRMKDKLTTP